MGYSHRWTLKNGIEPSLWDNFFRGAKEILDVAIESGIALEDSSQGPLIFFNGVKDGAHEDFAVTDGDVGFNFCKTAGKPYDTVVTAVLIHLKRSLGDAVSIDSDGNWSDWEGGRLLYETVFDIQPESVLS